MFSTLSMFVFLALVMYVVSSEVHAILGAVGYASKQTGSLLRKVSIGHARYQWASPLFHADFAESIGQAPAYRVFPILMLAVTAIGVFIPLNMLNLISVPMADVRSVAMFAGLGMFVSLYGKAFVAHRAHVATQVEQGTWALAAAV